MKRICIFMSLLLLSMASMAEQGPPFSGLGMGTEDDPFQVTNAKQLDELRNFLGGEYYYVELMNDIDLTDYIAKNYPNGWEPIGLVQKGYSWNLFIDTDVKSSFKGSFDGMFHKITGLSFKNMRDGMGLFAAFSGEVRSLSIEVEYPSTQNTYEDYYYLGGFCGVGLSLNCYNVHVTGAVGASDCQIAGGICGYAEGAMFYYCSFNGEVNGFSRIGGICGMSKGTEFETCSVEASIDAMEWVGGICGDAHGINYLDECTFKGSCHADSFCGGIAGVFDCGVIRECNVNCTLTGLGYMGGIVGDIHSDVVSPEQPIFIRSHPLSMMNSAKRYDVLISNCYSQGSAGGITDIGGIVGSDEWFIEIGEQNFSPNVLVEYCWSDMILQAYDDVGGIVGQSVLTGFSINQCVFIGKAMGGVKLTDAYHEEPAKHTGGLAGVFSGTIDDSYTEGSVTGVNYVGGLVGELVGGSIAHSYAHSYIFGKEYLGGLCGSVTGTSKSTATVEACFVNTLSPRTDGTPEHFGRCFGQVGAYSNIPDYNSLEGNVAITAGLGSTNSSMGYTVVEFESSLLNGRRTSYSACGLQRFYEDKGWNFSDIWSYNKYQFYRNQYPELLNVDPSKNYLRLYGWIECDTLTLNKHTGGRLRIKTYDLEDLKNYIGVQFRLILPKGVSIGKNEKGEFDIKPLGNLDGHSIACKLQDDGSYMVMVFSLDAKRFVPFGNGMMSMAIEVDESIQNDIYDIIIGDIVLAELKEGASVSTSVEDWSYIGLLEVTDGQPGDVNGDGDVNVTDVMVTVNHILGYHTGAFIEANADVNGDGSIDISDVMTIVLTVLSNKPADAMVSGIPTTSDKVSMQTMLEGIALTLENTQEYTAMQMNIQLPRGCKVKGMRFAGDDTHRVDYHQLDDGSWNVMIWSMTGETLPADNTFLEILTDHECQGQVLARNILLTSKQCETFIIDHSETDGIGGVTVSKEEGPVYNLSGAKVKMPHKGVYIQNGKKVLKK